MRSWLMCVCALASGLGHTAGAQLIDTAQEPLSTGLDSSNHLITVKTGFTYQVTNAKPRSRKTLPVRNGFTQYRVGVVETDQLIMAGSEVPVKGQKIWLAVVTRDKTLKLDTTLVGTALFVKAIVAGDNLQAKAKFWQGQARQRRQAADSLKQFLDSLQRITVVEPEQLGRLQNELYLAGEAEWSAGAYQMLTKRQGGKKLIKFFMSKWYGRGPLFSITSHPYGLPQVPTRKPLNALPKDTPIVREEFGKPLKNPF